MDREERFSSRWMLLACVLGMAIGTGNIWRFPRVVAQNGGGAFLIPWTVFLFLWSIPLLIIEFAFGSESRKGIIGSFIHFCGRRFAWMGAFVGFCTLAIMFYYSVVTGWCIKYFVASLCGGLRSFDPTLSKYYFGSLTSSWQSAGFHFIAIVLGCFIVHRGLVKGIEKVNIVLIPSLFAILILCVLRILTLPRGVSGIDFLFSPDYSRLSDINVWLEALSQSAWSTGAGWGLALTYAVYLRKRDDIVLNPFLTGFGDYSASLLAGIVIFGSVFALSSSSDVASSLVSSTGKASTGLTFEYLPVLFNRMPGGMLFSTIFFLALTFAAFSSLISMIELGVRVFVDFGWRRKKSVIFIFIVSFIFGVPSALSLDFLENQDWVWSLGLILNGFFFSIAASIYGIKRLRLTIVNKRSDIFIGKWFNIIVPFLIPFQFIILLLWWFSKSIEWDPNWWNPFHKYSIASVLFQWVTVILIFFLMNNKIAKSVKDVS